MTGDIIDADLQFHLAILEATGNHFIGALGGLIHAALLGTFKLGWESPAHMQESRLLQHRRCSRRSATAMPPPPKAI